MSWKISLILSQWMIKVQHFPLHYLTNVWTSHRVNTYLRNYQLVRGFPSYLLTLNLLPLWTSVVSCCLTLFRIDLFRGSHEWGAKMPPFPKTCHTYPRMIKVGTVISHLRKIQKYIDHVKHPFSFADISNFSLENQNFCYIKKYR